MKGCACFISFKLLIKSIHVLTYGITCFDIVARYKSVVHDTLHTYNFIVSSDIRLSYHFFSPHSSLCGNISCCRNSPLGGNAVSSNQIFPFDGSGSCNCFTGNCIFRTNITTAVNTASIDSTASIHIFCNVYCVFHCSQFIRICFN